MAMHVTLRQLKVFETVARHGSFTRAADELNLSQPTVSMQVKQLTDTVDQPLFHLVGKQVFLTEIGQDLLQTCKEIFTAWDRFEMIAADIKGLKRGRLRIATVTTGKYFVPRLLGPFCKQYPNIDAQFEIASRDAVMERLGKNEDDLYVMDSPPQHFDIQVHAFLDNPLIAVAPSAHPLAAMPYVPLETFAQELLLMRERGSGTRMATERFFRERGMALKVKMEIGSNEAIKHAVAGGLGVSVLSQWALAYDPMAEQIRVLNVEGFPITHAWYLLHSGARQPSVVAKAFLEYALRDGKAVLQKNASGGERPLLSVA